MYECIELRFESVTEHAAALAVGFPRWEAALHRTASGLPYGSRGSVRANSISGLGKVSRWRRMQIRRLRYYI